MNDMRGCHISKSEQMKALLPLIKVAASQLDGSSLAVKRAAVINISSILGSIAENEQGGLYPYRASKAALNAITKSLSLDLQSSNILVTSLHPGWVQTDMGGKLAPLTPTQSISGIITTLHNLTEQHHGGFYQYDGQKLPW
ncbi:C-factor-like [Homarus americanus]|uniref:C-factor-like n=1 Tax=Homarus americanus TaxID=6706 RepID=A0A8J5N8C1_HOMAM|nr:C-factor-like [Homarus americanus]